MVTVFLLVIDCATAKKVDEQTAAEERAAQAPASEIPPDDIPSVQDHFEELSRLPRYKWILHANKLLVKLPNNSNSANKPLVKLPNNSNRSKKE
eukprot:5540062-Amphidinium_carterae.1